MTKDFIGINHRKEQIKLPFKKHFPMLPTEVHLKEDGTLSNEPSLAFVLTHPNSAMSPVVGQISIKMLNEGLADIGYEIKKL